MGFWFGLVTAFGWQAIHIPLVYLTIAAFCWQLSGGGLVWGAVSNAFRQRDLEVRGCKFDPHRPYHRISLISIALQMVVGNNSTAREEN